MTHYAEVLGGEISGVFRNADAPDPESRMPGGDDMVMNMAMSLGTITRNPSRMRRNVSARKTRLVPLFCNQSRASANYASTRFSRVSL